MALNSSSQPTDHSPLNITSPTYIYSEVHEFHKGTKHNTTLYPVFKDDQQYHDTHAIASVHGTEEVFNSHYSPTETSQALVWLEINCFMFSVFCKNLQASVGHMLIKHHSDSGDAQLLTKELCTRYENSIYT